MKVLLDVQSNNIKAYTTKAPHRFFVKNMSRCAKYPKPGQGVGVGLEITHDQCGLFVWHIWHMSVLHDSHPKTLFEIAMALLTISVCFPSKSRFSATFSILLRFGESWNPTNCEIFNADGSLMGRTNLDKSVW